MSNSVPDTILNSLRENCEVVQIADNEYMQLLNNMPFFSRKNCIEFRKQVSGNLRHWFLVKSEALNCSMAFYETLSSDSYYDKEKLIIIEEEIKNVIRSTAYKTTEPFSGIDYTKFIPLPLDVMIHDDIEFQPMARKNIDNMYETLANTLPIDKSKTNVTKKYKELLLHGIRQIYHGKDDSTHTDFYSPTALYLLQVCNFCRELPSTDNKILSINAVPDYNLQKAYVKDMQTFLGEIPQIYASSLSLLVRILKFNDTINNNQIYSNAYSTYQQLSKNPKSITLQLKEKDCAEIPEQEKVIILKIEIMINKLEEYTANVFGKLDKFLNHDNKQTTKTFADSLIKNISFSTKFSDLAFLKNINTYIHINNNDESTIREKKAFSNVNLKDLQVVANLSLLLNKTSTEIANRMKIESQKPNNTLELQKKNKDDKLTIKINKSVNSAKHFNMLVKDFQELDLGFSKDCLELDKKICSSLNNDIIYLKDSFDMITNYYKNVTDPTKIKDVFKSIKNSFDVRDSIYQEKPIIKKLITASTENLTTLETKISTELTRDEELEVSFANAIGESENIIQLSKHMQDIQIFTQDIYNVIVQISKIDVDLKVLSSLYLELGNDKIAIPDSIINCVKNILANKVQEITNNLNEDLRCSNRNHVPINIINEYKKNVNIEIDKSKQHIKTINKLVSSLSNISKEINSTYKEYQTSPIILCVNKQKDEEQSQQDFADSAKLMQALYNCFSNDNDVVAKDIADERTDNSLQELINSLSSGITGGQVFANTLKLKTKTFRKLIEKLNELVAETTQSMLDSDPNLYIDKIFEKLKKLPIYSTPYNFDELYIYLNKEEVKTRFIPEYYDTQNIINSYLKESSPYNFLLNTLCAYKEIESKKLDDLIPKITDLSSKELNEILTKLFEILIEKNKCTKHVLEENIQYFVNRIIELIEIKNKEQLQTFKNKTFNSPLNNPQSSNSDDNMEDLNQKIGDYRLKGLIQLSLCKDNNLFQSIDDKDTEIQEIQEPQEEIQETNSQSE